jgi:hypothetical protein
MMLPALLRTIASPSVGEAGAKGGAVETADRWQDKGPRCAAWDGRCFSMGYLSSARGVLVPRSLRARHFANFFSDFTRCAGLQP